MTEVTLHPLPRWREVVREQIRIVGLSLLPALLVVAVVLGIGTLLLVKEVISGGAGFDSNEMFPVPMIAFLLPFAVWRSEKRYGPSFLWTLPVNRRGLALAKVIAGGVWLMAAMAFFVTWLLTLAFLAGASPAQQLARVPFVPTMALYLLGSALVLGLRHPLRWLLGAAGLVLLMGGLGDLFNQPDDSEWNYVPGARTFFSLVQKTVAALLSLPDLAQWAIGTALWFGAALIALWIALSRHRERRRH